MFLWRNKIIPRFCFRHTKIVGISRVKPTKFNIMTSKRTQNVYYMWCLHCSVLGCKHIYGVWYGPFHFQQQLNYTFPRIKVYKIHTLQTHSEVIKKIKASALLHFISVCAVCARECEFSLWILFSGDLHNADESNVSRDQGLKLEWSRAFLSFSFFHFISQKLLVDAYKY